MRSGALRDFHHGFEHGRLRIDQRERSRVQDRAVNHVVDDRLAEKVAAGPDDDDLRALFHMRILSGFFPILYPGTVAFNRGRMYYIG